MIALNFYTILATVINVLVLFLLVQKFLMKPVGDILAKREAMIKANFEEARSAEADAKKMKNQYEENLKNAHEESMSIIEKARTNAQAEYDRIVCEADEKAKSIVNKAEKDIALEKEQALKEAKTEIGDLIALAVGKVAAGKATPQSDRELINQFLADVDSEN